MSNQTSTLPTNVFEGVAPALVDVVEAVHREDETVIQHKQSVAHAANEFKQRVVTAREVIEKLPGGEMHLGDQDEVIAMLKALRDQKRRHLDEFSKYRAIKSLTDASKASMDEAP